MVSNFFPEKMVRGRVSNSAFSAGVLLIFGVAGLMRPYGALAQPGGDGMAPGNSSSSMAPGNGSSSMAPGNGSSSGGGMPPDMSTSSASATGVVCNAYGTAADYTEELRYVRFRTCATMFS